MSIIHMRAFETVGPCRRSLRRRLLHLVGVALAKPSRHHQCFVGLGSVQAVAETYKSQERAGLVCASFEIWGRKKKRASTLISGRIRETILHPL